MGHRPSRSTQKRQLTRLKCCTRVPRSSLPCDPPVPARPAGRVHVPCDQRSLRPAPRYPQSADLHTARHSVRQSLCTQHHARASAARAPAQAGAAEPQTADCPGAHAPTPAGRPPPPFICPFCTAARFCSALDLLLGDLASSTARRGSRCRLPAPAPSRRCSAPCPSTPVPVAAATTLAAGAMGLPPPRFSSLPTRLATCPTTTEPRVGDVPCCVSRGMLPPGERPSQTQTTHTARPPY